MYFILIKKFDKVEFNQTSTQKYSNMYHIP